MNLMVVRMELARMEGFPEGSHRHGYEFIAPLTPDGHLDVEAWRAEKKQCRVHRFWEGQPEEQGLLRHVGHGWRFDYREGDSDDEPFFKLDNHPLAIGTYVSVTEHDGVQRPFRVVSVRTLGKRRPVPAAG